MRHARARMTLSAALAAALVAGCPALALAEEAEDVSFYTMAASAAGAYEDATTADGDDSAGADYLDESKFDPDTPAYVAGGFRGFYDDTVSDASIIGAVTSFLSSSSQAHSYLASRRAEGISEYMEYGHALQSLGLDTSTHPASSLFMFIVRLLFGLVLLLMYNLAKIASSIFGFVAQVLSLVNPFRFLTANNADSPLAKLLPDSTFSDAPAAVQPLFEGLASVMTPLRRLMTTLYVSAQDLGFVVTMPLLVSAFVVSVLLLNRTREAPSMLRKLVTRFLFIGLGIPLLGSLYTAALDACATSFSDVDAATTIVAQHLVDFQTWARECHLSLPDGSSIVVQTSPTGSSGGSVVTSALRVADNDDVAVTDLALAVNDHARSSLAQATMQLVGGYTTDELESRRTTAAFQRAMRRYSSTLPELAGINSQMAVSSIIGKWMMSEVYTASSFESDERAASEVTATRNLGLDKIDKYQVSKWQELGGTGEEASSKTGTRAYLRRYMLDGGALSVSRNDATGRITYSSDATKGDGKGLSSLATYNYLTTAFNESEMAVYASHRVASEVTLSNHLSVSLIGGTSLLRVLYYLHMVSGLAFAAVIGLGYGLDLVFSNLKRSLRWVASVPFAMLGSLKEAARVVAVVVMMVIEILVTLLLYALIMEAWLLVGHIFETAGSTLTTSVFGGGATALIVGAGGPTVTTAAIDYGAQLVSLLLGIVVNFLLIKHGLALRKELVGTIDSEAASVIDRVFGLGGAAGESNREPGPAAQAAAADRAARAGENFAAGVAGGAMGLASAAAGAARATGAEGEGDAAGEGDAPPEPPEGYRDGGAEAQGGTTEQAGGHGGGMEIEHHDGVGGPLEEAGESEGDGLEAARDEAPAGPAPEGAPEPVEQDSAPAEAALAQQAEAAGASVAEQAAEAGAQMGEAAGQAAAGAAARAPQNAEGGAAGASREPRPAAGERPASAPPPDPRQATDTASERRLGPDAAPPDPRAPRPQRQDGSPQPPHAFDAGQAEASRDAAAARLEQMQARGERAETIARAAARGAHEGFAAAYRGTPLTAAELAALGAGTAVARQQAAAALADDPGRSASFSDADDLDVAADEAAGRAQPAAEESGADAAQAQDGGEAEGAPSGGSAGGSFDADHDDAREQLALDAEEAQAASGGMRQEGGSEAETAPPADDAMQAVRADAAGQAGAATFGRSSRRPTARQLAQLRRLGFANAESWSYEEASRVMDMLAANGWQVPDGIDAASYVPSRHGMPQPSPGTGGAERTRQRQQQRTQQRTRQPQRTAVQGRQAGSRRASSDVLDAIASDADVDPARVSRAARRMRGRAAGSGGSGTGSGSSGSGGSGRGSGGA